MARPKLQLKPVSTGTGKLDLKPGTTTVPIGSILLRKDGDSRPLSAGHVVTLTESIAALGILEPVVVDLDGRLLAGGHRLAALQLLVMPPMARRQAFLDRLMVDDAPVAAPADAPAAGAVASLADRMAQINVEAFTELYPTGKVPVVAVDTSGKDRDALALAVEAAENSIRKQYNRAEVQVLAAQLKKAGYISREGRPRTGEKSARPVLEALLGVSGRHLRRLLGQDKPIEKDDWTLAVEALRRATAGIAAAGKGQRSPTRVKVIELAAKLAKALPPKGN